MPEILLPHNQKSTLQARDDRHQPKSRCILGDTVGAFQTLGCPWQRQRIRCHQFPSDYHQKNTLVMHNQPPRSRSVKMRHCIAGLLCTKHVPLDPFSKMRHHAMLPGTKESTKCHSMLFAQSVGARPLKSKWSGPSSAGPAKQVPDLTSCQARIVRRLRTSPSTSNSQLRAPSNVHARQSRSHHRMPKSKQSTGSLASHLQMSSRIEECATRGSPNENCHRLTLPEKDNHMNTICFAHISSNSTAPRMIADVEQKLGPRTKEVYASCTCRRASSFEYGRSLAGDAVRPDVQHLM